MRYLNIAFILTALLFFTSCSQHLKSFYHPVHKAHVMLPTRGKWDTSRGNNRYVMRKFPYEPDSELVYESVLLKSDISLYNDEMHRSHICYVTLNTFPDTSEYIQQLNRRWDSCCRHPGRIYINDVRKRYLPGTHRKYLVTSTGRVVIGFFSSDSRMKAVNLFEQRNGYTYVLTCYAWRPKYWRYRPMFGRIMRSLHFED